MNISKLIRIAILLQVMSFAIAAQALNPQVYGQLKAYLVMTDHSTAEELKARIDAATDIPVPYLAA